MALDIGAIYGVNGQTGATPDIGQVYGNALKIRQMQTEQQTQNALKSILSNPANIGPDGLPTDAADAQMMRVSPENALKFLGMKSQVEERKALTDDRRQTEFRNLDNYVQQVVRGPASAAYDKALAAGMTPQAAQAAGQRVYDEGLDEIKTSGRFGSDQTSSFDPHFDPARVAARSKMNALSNAPKSGDVETITDSSGNTFDHDKVRGTNKFVSGPAELEEGADYTPAGSVQKIGGGGTLRSPAAMATAKFIQENPGATAQDIADFGARYKTTEITGTAPAKTDTSALNVLTKQRAAVESFEGTAKKEADLALSLLDKGGGTTGIPALNRWIQAGRKDLGGDPDVTAFNSAVTSFANEYARIMTAPGATGGGATSDSARNEASSLINSAFTPEQFRRTISTMKKSMENRISSLDDALDKARDRVAGDAPSGSAARGERPTKGDTGSVPERSIHYLRSHPDSKAMFDARYGAGAAERILGQ